VLSTDRGGRLNRASAPPRRNKFLAGKFGLSRPGSTGRGDAPCGRRRKERAARPASFGNCTISRAHADLRP
jgi:hypothetical protein